VVDRAKVRGAIRVLNSDRRAACRDCRIFCEKGFDAKLHLKIPGIMFALIINL
jgi:hypothetical protein